MSNTTTCPEGRKHTTLDEAAECLNVSRDTYATLWGLMPPDRKACAWCKGTGTHAETGEPCDCIPPNGEWPEPDSPSRMARALPKFWDQLSETERQEIITAATKEGWL